MPQVVRSNAFYHVPSLAKLNLSGNKIYKIEDLAFKVNIGDGVWGMLGTEYSAFT